LLNEDVDGELSAEGEPLAETLPTLRGASRHMGRLHPNNTYWNLKL